MAFYKIKDKKMVKVLFWLCFLVYFTSYLGRLNYSAALAEIIEKEGFSKSAAGMVGTGFFIAYGTGQLISGFLGDRLSPKWMIFTGISISAVLNFIMPTLSNPYIMTVIWAFNGFAQALLWSPMLRLLFEYLEEDERKKACVTINSSMPLGTMTAYGMTALVIGLSGWRMTFITAGILLFLVAIVWIIGIKQVERDADIYGKEQEQKMGVHMTAKNQHSIKGILLGSGVLFLLVAMMVQGALKDGVTTWIPTYIKETYGLSSILAIISTMFIPLFNLCGVFFASMADKKWFHNELKTSAAFFGICAGSLIILFMVSGKSMPTAFAMLAICTTSMMAVNTMLVSVLPSRFGKLGKASSVSGILNSAVYIGSAVSTYGIGALSGAVGWNCVIVIWFAFAFIAGVICFLTTKTWIKYKKRFL